MSAKIYKAHNNLSVPNMVNGKISGYIEFTDEKNTFRTSDEALQKSLEALPCFGSLFTLYREEKEEPVNHINNEKVELPDVTDWQEAKTILQKDYSVAHQSLNKPENILKKAAEVGISFPNLKLETTE